MQLINVECRLLAEVSNPFLIFRTLLKILGKKDTKFYRVNDIVFAVVFITARVLVTPLLMVYIYEGENILYSVKLGISLVLYVQLFWAYRIIELIFETIVNSYTDKL